MSCLICELKNKELKQSVERYLDIYSGVIPITIKAELKASFPDEESTIEKLNDDECLMHWNFHQSASYVPAHIDAEEKENNSSSLRNDIGKDEASVLYDLMAKQMETFNRLTKRINDALDNTDNDLTHAIVNPITIDLYDKVTSGIRSSVKDLKELNTAVKGEKNSSLDGLKAIAVALSTPLDNKSQNAAITGVQVGVKDLSTDKYDY